jgi:hypothetical protein
MKNMTIHDRKVREYPAQTIKECSAGRMIFEGGKPGKSAFIVQSGII